MGAREAPAGPEGSTAQPLDSGERHLLHELSRRPYYSTNNSRGDAYLDDQGGGRGEWKRR